MSENTTTQLSLPDKFKEVASRLNGSILSVIGQENLILFEKAYQIALATNELKSALTPEYMKPMMALQGSKLGFKTDKDASGGYPEETVKNCLIEAVLTGVMPFGNQFNIIAGNCYFTKEGMGELLGQMVKRHGLRYEIVPELPRVSDKSAAIVMHIKWTFNGESREQKLDIPIKVNSFMGTDAIIGKATRKARAWLFNTINGTEIGDGDITDTQAEVLSSRPFQTNEYDRVVSFIEKATTLDELKNIEAKTGGDILEQVRPVLNEKHEAILSMQPTQ